MINNNNYNYCFYYKLQWSLVGTQETCHQQANWSFVGWFKKSELILLS